MILEFRPTSRGFIRADFRDANGDECSVQESSSMGSLEPGDNGPYLWLGQNEAGGKPARMHLTQAMVRELLPALQQWAETGELPVAEGEARPAVQTVCAYCGRAEGHSRRCSVTKFGVDESRMTATQVPQGPSEATTRNEREALDQKFRDGWFEAIEDCAQEAERAAYLLETEIPDSPVALGARHAAKAIRKHLQEGKDPMGEFRECTVAERRGAYEAFEKILKLSPHDSPAYLVAAEAIGWFAPSATPSSGDDGRGKP